MPRESDVAIWLHAVRLASPRDTETWNRAFDAQQEHAREQGYSCGSPVTLALLDDAAWKFIQEKAVLKPIDAILPPLFGGLQDI